MFINACLLFSITSIIQTPSAFAHTNNSEGYSLIEVNENNLDYELKLDLTELGHSMNKEMDEHQSFDTKTSSGLYQFPY